MPLIANELLAISIIRKVIRKLALLSESVWQKR